jgi:hypothetical protein
MKCSVAFRVIAVVPAATQWQRTLPSAGFPASCRRRPCQWRDAIQLWASRGVDGPGTGHSLTEFFRRSPIRGRLADNLPEFQIWAHKSGF